ncbi:MAG: hypothetical protein H6834_08975 [Planctomycetes bacterium]|nr:hypothetical protein [Planctomycetota bacterium]
MARMLTLTLLILTPFVFTACSSTQDGPSEADLSAVEMNLFEYLNAAERERATRIQATGEHPVAEQALRDLEDSIRDHAQGDLRDRYVLAIDERLRNLETPDDPSGEALRHLRSVITK